MLDIHSHILPKMDDGSRSTEMSEQMLRESYRQGVTTLVSTSHFYADAESPDRFLRRRAHAIEKLESLNMDSIPRIVYGAEVLYYPGISQSTEIRPLAIEGSSLFLLEMPFVRWSQKIFDELLSFQYHSGLKLVIAHVERYLPLENRALYEQLFDLPFYFQCNAEAFSSFRMRKLALEMLENDQLHFLGTDCHNTTSRPPNMKIAREMIIKKHGRSAWERFTAEADDLFFHHYHP